MDNAVNSYIDNCLKTEPDASGPISRLNNERTIRLLHGAIGLTTEAGELADQIKKHVFYGKAVDYVNLGEEIGDCLWYMSLILKELGLDYETVMTANIEKLRKRYPGKFTEKDAINRDILNERIVLDDRLRRA